MAPTLKEDAGRWSLHGSCKLSLNKIGARPTNRSKDTGTHHNRRYDITGHNHYNTNTSEAERRGDSPAQGPCQKRERRDHETKGRLNEGKIVQGHEDNPPQNRR